MATDLSGSSERERKPYERPTVEDLGTLAELTKGSTGPEQDIVTIGSVTTS